MTKTRVAALATLIIFLGEPVSLQAQVISGGAPAATTASTPGEKPAVRPAAAGKPFYIYDTLRVINDTNPKGCSSGNWTCMANLCKTEVGAASWRGDAGCWSQGAKFICYFECGIWREVN